VPVHDDHQIQKALAHGDVRNVRTPDLIAPHLLFRLAVAFGNKLSTSRSRTSATGKLSENGFFRANFALLSAQQSEFTKRIK
jgi:hypothetical protein